MKRKGSDKAALPKLFLVLNTFLFLSYKNLSIQYFFLCVWLIHAVFLISAPISTTYA